MDFSELVKQRRSIRHYESRPVEEELLLGLCEAARWAPSALNMQPWEFIIVTDPEIRQQLGDTAAILGIKWPHLKTAPAAIVICARKTSTYARDDCLLAAQNMMLQATDLGLGTCYVGGFASDAVRELLSIPAGYIVPGIVTVGYPAGTPPAPEKRALTEMVHCNTFEGRGLSLSGYGRAWRTFWKILGGRLSRKLTPEARSAEEQLALPPDAFIEPSESIWEHADEDRSNDEA